MFAVVSLITAGPPLPFLSCAPVWGFGGRRGSLDESVVGRECYIWCVRV